VLTSVFESPGNIALRIESNKKRSNLAATNAHSWKEEKT